MGQEEWEIKVIGYIVHVRQERNYVEMGNDNYGKY